VSFDQVHALGELYVRWSGDDEGEVAVSEEFDGVPTGAPLLATKEAHDQPGH
jgi:segregation and condensation protein A